MKRTLSILLTIAMIISLIPAVFAADVPTMSTTVDKTEVQPGDTITLTLSIDKTITNLNNWEWAIYFDKDQKRVFVEEQPIECIKQYYRYIHFQKIG